MSQDTTNLILVVFAFVATIGNVIAFLVARVELRAQGKETKALAVLTTDLEHKVHRLAADLDYRIGMLNRVRDLVTGLIETSTILRQNIENYGGKLNAAVKRDMTFPELDALARHINDEKLTALTKQLIDIVTKPYDLWPQLWNEAHMMIKPEIFEQIDVLLIEQSSCTRQIHQRILELVEETTQTEK